MLFVMKIRSNVESIGIYLIVLDVYMYLGCNSFNSMFYISPARQPYMCACLRPNIGRISPDNLVIVLQIRKDAIAVAKSHTCSYSSISFCYFLC